MTAERSRKNMKIPETMSTHCPRCRTHTNHNVSAYKTGKAMGAKLGERRQSKRRKGDGGKKYPIQHNQAKVTRKQSMMMVCTECGYTKQRKGVRLSKMEFVN